MSKCSAYVGLDVHKETIAVAVARPRGGEVTSFGVIANRPAAVRKLLAKLGPDGQVLEVCYEAGPAAMGCTGCSRNWAIAAVWSRWA